MIILIEKTCCISGHRNIPLHKLIMLRKKIRKTLISLVDNGIVYFGCGGAVGFDTIAAEEILRLKKKKTHIKLIMVYPCKDQTKYWSKKDKKRYLKIKDKSDKIVYTSENYDNTCMYKRNRHLVNSSSICLCYLKKQFGGTFYTVNYAYRKGLKVINLANKYLL